MEIKETANSSLLNIYFEYLENIKLVNLIITTKTDRLIK